MITIRDLRKAFGANRVLQGVNLDVARGESMVIIGGSGTGKSVLLKCILGLVEPDAGQRRPVAGRGRGARVGRRGAPPFGPAQQLAHELDGRGHHVSRIEHAGHVRPAPDRGRLIPLRPLPHPCQDRPALRRGIRRARGERAAARRARADSHSANAILKDSAVLSGAQYETGFSSIRHLQ